LIAIEGVPADFHELIVTTNPDVYVDHYGGNKYAVRYANKFRDVVINGSLNQAIDCDILGFHPSTVKSFFCRLLTYVRSSIVY
jgi:hypothetical protein